MTGGFACRFGHLERSPFRFEDLAAMPPPACVAWSPSPASRRRSTARFLPRLRGRGRAPRAGGGGAKSDLSWLDSALVCRIRNSPYLGAGIERISDSKHTSNLLNLVWFGFEVRNRSRHPDGANFKSSTLDPHPRVAGATATLA